jgi:monoamine oxidase
VQDKQVVIIGGGLSGLVLAYKLLQKNIQTIILEASSRIGGRIQTINGNLHTPLELGATWVSDMHPNLLSLMEELGVEKFTQYSKGISLFQTKSFEPPQKFYVPESENPSYRIGGGTQKLIDALIKKLDVNTIHLNSKVISIKEDQNKLSIETSNGQKWNADKVIICVPPQLAGQIYFSPQLPDALSQILPTVQTWMLGSIKFALEYSTPFWRKNGYSGMLYSHTGIVVEMYDHVNIEENKFGFTGFLNSSASSYTPELRKELVLQQLELLLGKEVLNPSIYIDKVWTDEFISAENQLIQTPHQNNGHSLLQENYMNEKLFFSGTETAISFSGYMEGAVIAANNIINKWSH